jgi:hypothetical protein
MWPTPRAEDGESCGNHPGAVDSLTGAAKLWPTAHANCTTGAGSQGRDGGDNLQTVADLWPTPPTDSFRSRGGDQQARMFPTPASRDYRTPNKRSYQDRSGTTKGEQLPNFVEHHSALLQDPATPAGEESSPNTPGSRRLCPRFVEFLLGLPIGWTELE